MLYYGVVWCVGLLRAMRRPRRAAAENLWAPPPTFVDRRAAADNLSARRRCHCCCVVILLQFSMTKISNWTGANNLRLNPEKTKELIVFKSVRRRVMPPSNPIIRCAVRVTTLRVLGVEITFNLGMSAHIDQVLASCASSMYALRVLRCHGLPPPQLHEVARATTMASLMYASPSWWGFSSAQDRSRTEQLINKFKRSGFLPELAPLAAALAGEADERLFRAVISDNTHVLRKHLPEVRQLSYNLRPRPHGFLLPSKDDRNFISRLLYKDMY